MWQNLIFALFSKKVTHDLAATSNAAKIFFLRKQTNSVIMNLKMILFDQKKLNRKSVLFLVWTSIVISLEFCQMGCVKRMCYLLPMRAAKVQASLHIRAVSPEPLLLALAVSQEEPSDRKPNPWLLWMAEHAQLKFVITECWKTQIRLTRLKWWCIWMNWGMCKKFFWQ